MTEELITAIITACLLSSTTEVPIYMDNEPAIVIEENNYETMFNEDNYNDETTEISDTNNDSIIEKDIDIIEDKDNNLNSSNNDIVIDNEPNEIKDIKEFRTSYEYTKYNFDIDKEYVQSNIEILKDKKITCIGDSITEGVGSSKLDDNTYNSYCNYLSKIIGTTVINMGKGGAPIGDYWDSTALYLRWTDIPVDTDIIIIFAGINDFFIGKYDDFVMYTTDLLTNIKNTYTSSKIYTVISYPIKEETEGNFVQNDYSKYMNTLKDISLQNDIQIIDLYNENYMNTNEKEIRDSYVPDGIHPNDLGNELLAYHIAHKIME